MTTDQVDFNSEVIESSNELPVLVDFWAAWCGPCKFLGPIVEKLANKAGGRWKLVKVNTEAQPGLAREWGIKGIPNLKLFYKGKVISEVTGAMAEPDLKRWLEQQLPSKAKSLLLEAREYLDAGNHHRAKKDLELAIELENLQEARILLARMLLWDDTARALDLLKGAEHVDQAAGLLLIGRSINATDDLSGEGTAAQMVREGMEHLRKQEHQQALEKLIQSVIMDKNYKDEIARRLIIAIFHYLGENHEITREYRKKFDMALY